MKRISLISIGILALALFLNCNPTSSNNNSANTITDIDGNVYHTVTIGTQTWTVENLKTTKFNDGIAIPIASDSASWWDLTTPGCCWYKNDAATYKNTYGALYNWYAVNTGKLAPAGWHVPADSDWDTLQNYLIANGYNYDGTTTGNKIAKALAAQTKWSIDTTNNGATGNSLSTNNKSGFAAYPGGCRDDYCAYYDIGEGGYWWGSDGYRYCLFNHSVSLFSNTQLFGYGYSVRLVKNN